MSQIFSRQRIFSAGQEIVTRAGQPLPYSLLVDGWAARYKILSNGRRQVTGILLPGDFIDLQRLSGEFHVNSIVALLPCHVAMSDHDAIAGIEARSPRVASHLWLDGMIEHAVLQEWLVAMGRRSAVGRMAHLLCELYVRLWVVFRNQSATFRLPLTQSDLADVLGISIVHVNRTLRALRAEKAAIWNNQTVSILDWTSLTQIAEFDPGYLGYPDLFVDLPAVATG